LDGVPEAVLSTLISKPAQKPISGQDATEERSDH